MSRAGNPPEIVDKLREALEAEEAVASVTLGGSRERGAPTELSDWDLYLRGDPDKVVAAIPALVSAFEPLAEFWEPLAEEAGYMVVMDGPVKIDLFPVGATRPIQPPWALTADTLVSIDGHFWDWLLWLGGKSLRGERRLVTDELLKMHWFLLAPMGVERSPESLDEACTAYLEARSRATAELGVAVRAELGRQVAGALRRHGLLGE